MPKGRSGRVRRRHDTSSPPAPVRRDSAVPQAPTRAQGHGVVALQSILGNQGVNRLLSGDVQRDPSSGGGNTSTLSKPPSHPPPPPPRKRPPPPNVPAPPIPTQGTQPEPKTTEPSKLPHEVAQEALTAAHGAAVNGATFFGIEAGKRLSGSGARTIGTTAGGGAVNMLIESLVTDALAKVMDQVVGKKNSKGKVIKKGLKGKVVFDDVRFASLVPGIENAVRTRGASAPVPGSETPAKDEYVRMAAKTVNLTDPKKKKKFVEKAGMAAAQKGSEAALSKSAVVLNEAEKHRAPMVTAATTAANQVFDLQVSMNRENFSRDIKNAALLQKSLEGGAFIPDLIDNALRLKVRAEDRGSAAAIDSIETLATDAAEAAASEQLNEIRPKAGIALQKHLTKNLNVLETVTKAAEIETDKLMTDPAFAKQSAEEAVDSTLEGKMNSKLKFIASICGKGKRPGDTKTIDVIIRVPVDPSGVGFLGFQVRTTSRRNDDLSLAMHAEMNLVGGAKIPGVDVEAMGQLGGYFDIKVANDPTGQRKDAEAAGNLLSYGLYRRFRESPIVPHALADWLWGAGGKSADPNESKSDAKFREAETWAKAIEEAMAEGDSVETGALLGGRAKAKVAGVGIKGGAAVLTGKRYNKKTVAEGRKKQLTKTGKKAKAQKLGEGVTRLRVDASAGIGPLTAGADFAITFRDQPGKDEDRIIDAELNIFAQGMVMKKAMFGDPAEAAVRIVTWLAEIGLFGQKLMDHAEQQATSMKKNRPGYKDFKLAKKGQKLGMEPYKAGSAVFSGEWQSQHEQFEQAQAIQEGAGSITEVGDKMGELGGNLGSGVSEGIGELGNTVSSVPGSVSSLDSAPITGGLGKAQMAMNPALQNIGELKSMILDKTAGLKLNLGMSWPEGGSFTGNIGIDYVKRTGAFILNSMKTTGLIDASFETTNRLVNFQFAPTRKFSWLYDDVDKQKLVSTKDYLVKMAKMGR